jgi:hypothetical protein
LEEEEDDSDSILESEAIETDPEEIEIYEEEAEDIGDNDQTDDDDTSTEEDDYDSEQHDSMPKSMFQPVDTEESLYEIPLLPD